MGDGEAETAVGDGLSVALLRLKDAKPKSKIVILLSDGMSNIGAVEWYLQAANFEQYCIGKTAEELRATETVEDGDHVLFADEELRATCSISIEGMVNVVAKAADNAA